MLASGEWGKNGRDGDLRAVTYGLHAVGCVLGRQLSQAPSPCIFLPARCTMSNMPPPPPRRPGSRFRPPQPPTAIQEDVESLIDQTADLRGPLSELYSHTDAHGINTLYACCERPHRNFSFTHKLTVSRCVQAQFRTECRPRLAQAAASMALATRRHCARRTRWQRSAGRSISIQH